MTPDELKESRSDRRIFRDMTRRHKDALVGGPGDEDDDTQETEEFGEGAE